MTQAGTADAVDEPGNRPGIRAFGVVIDKRTEQPIPGAEVTAPMCRDVEITDDGGRFELSIPFDEAGSTVIATCAGYVATRVTIRPADVCDLAAELRIALPPADLAGAIRGTIVDAVGGEPLSGAVVRLPDNHDWPGSAAPQMVAIEPIVTGNQGHFELRPLPPGRYDVLVEAPQHETWRRNAIEIEHGQDVDLGTVALGRFGWATVHGRIVGADGAAIGGVAVEVRTQHDNHMSRTTRSDRDGRYVLQGVRPGDVVLSFDAADRWQAWRSIELRADEDSRQDVRVPAGSHFVGGAVVVGGRPAADFDVECSVPTTALSQAGLDAFQCRARSDCDGRFRIDQLPGGPVDLNFSRSRPWVLESAENVAIDRLDQRFVFDSVTSTLTVGGTVRTADGAALAGVLIAPLQEHASSARATTAVDGSYGLTLAASGHTGIVLRAAHPRYVPTTRVIGATLTDQHLEVDFVLTATADTVPLTVRAMSRGMPIQQAGLILYTIARTSVANGITDSLGIWRGELVPELWRVFVRHPAFEVAKVEVDLTVPRDEPLTIELTPRNRYERMVELRTTPDVPLPGEKIIAWQRGAWIDEARTDELGRAYFIGLPGGDVELSAAPIGHARHELRVRLEQASDEPILFRVQPGLLSLSGQVLHSGGSPVASAEVHCRSRTEGGGVQAVTKADTDGRFSFSNLPPGEYELMAFRGHELARCHATAGAPPVVMRER